MPVKLKGSTSGDITLDVPAVAGTNTVTIAAQTGTLNAAGPAFSAYRSGSQTISSGSYAKIQFNAEDFDTNNNFDSTTNYRFTPTVAGYYLITLILYASSSTTTVCYTAIYKNGTSIAEVGQSLSGQQEICASHLVYLNGSTDYLEGFAYITATTPTIGSGNTRMTGCLLRGA